MGEAKIYMIEKLAMINYRMAVHEGDARKRLASQIDHILILPKSEVPEKYRATFQNLIDVLEKTTESVLQPGLKPVHVASIQNRTAVKYIQLLIEIKEALEDE